MALLSAHVSRLPPIIREKFSSQFWIDSANEILERLSSEQLMKELTLRRGVLVEFDKYITPPSNYRSCKDLLDPSNGSVSYRWVESDGKLVLTDAEVFEEDDPLSANTIDSFQSMSLRANIDGLSENALKDHLLVVTGGTSTNETVIVAGNDESSDGTTIIRFAHAPVSAFNSARVTSIDLIYPDFWLLMVYSASYSEISSVSDEIPIRNDHERQIMKSGLLLKGYERLYGPGSDKVVAFERSFERAIMKAREEIFTFNTSSRPRARMWAGLVNDNYLDADEGNNNEE